MNQQKIAIIADSGTDLTEKMCAPHDIRLVPLGVTYTDGSSYRAGIDITTEKIIERFDEEIPKTSLPSPKDIKEAFDAARADGYEKAIFVCISSGLSATYETTKLVARDMEDFPIIVVDTKSIGVAAGLVAIAAARMVEANVPFDELQGKLDALSCDTHVFFCVRDLKWLHAGGRIDDFTYRVGNVLNIKPIIWCDGEGKYRTYKKARGWDRALSQEVRCIKEYADKFEHVIVGIDCTTAENSYDELEKRIRTEVPNVVEFIEASISPALIVHTGPNLAGVGVQPTYL